MHLSWHRIVVVVDEVVDVVVVVVVVVVVARTITLTDAGFVFT